MSTFGCRSTARVLPAVDDVPALAAALNLNSEVGIDELSQDAGADERE